MASPACCAAGPPIVSDYQPKGSVSKAGERETYFIGSGPKAIVVIYDIFGFSTQTKQVCDTLAEAGYNVAMPDIFEGKPWLLENFPPKDRDVFLSWLGEAGNWEDVVLPVLKSTMAHMKEQKGVEVFGLLGFCWGGKISMQAASLGTDGGIKAAGCVHPAFLSEELAKEVKVPMLILPSGDEPDLSDVTETLKKKDFGDKCFFHRFDDMHHGFCAARGDWTKADQAARASEALGMVQKFFASTL